MLSQVLEIIFEVKRKMSNEKITRREINFLSYKTRLFIYLFFGPLLFSNLIIFFFLIRLIRFKML